MATPTETVARIVQYYVASFVSPSPVFCLSFPVFRLSSSPISLFCPSPSRPRPRRPCGPPTVPQILKFPRPRTVHGSGHRDVFTSTPLTHLAPSTQPRHLTHLAPSTKSEHFTHFAPFTNSERSEHCTRYTNFTMSTNSTICKICKRLGPREIPKPFSPPARAGSPARYTNRVPALPYTVGPVATLTRRRGPRSRPGRW